MAPSTGAGKARKTFSLSRESVRFLESLRKAGRGKSISSVLEDLIRQRRQAEEMNRISASVTAALLILHWPRKANIRHEVISGSNPPPARTSP